ncbi:MAG: AMP-binding protein [Sphingobium sp.]
MNARTDDQLSPRPSTANPASTCLALFRASVARAPDADAILYFDGRLSYADLDRLSDAMAAGLIARGFDRGDRLGIYVQNMPHCAIAMLAAWKAGGIPVPINAMNREREVTLLLADFEPKAFVLTPELYRDVLARLPDTVVRPDIVLGASPFDFQTRNDPRVLPADMPASVEGLEDMLGFIQAFEGETPPHHVPAGDDIACLIYTSGTTGVPKGAMILHRNVAAGVAVNCELFEAVGSDRVLGMAPLFHVTGMLSMNMMWGVAGGLILCYRFEPGVMVEAVREHQATLVMGAATAYIAMMNAPGASPDDMKTLRRAGSGGAPTPPAVAEAASRFLGVPIQNGYGMTETAIATNLTPFEQPIPVDPENGALSIGPLVPGVKAWIERAEGGAAADGEAGELVVSGPTLTGGYWRKPAETAEVFREDGFRTGDIAIRDANGWYYIVDRKKDMIVASGFKVWPREVEDVLYGHPAVREAAVVGVEDPYRGETVRAVVSLKPGTAVSIEELETHCREKLATYKRPREIAIVDELPKTPSGKILRRMLRGEDWRG